VHVLPGHQEHRTGNGRIFPHNHADFRAAQQVPAASWHAARALPLLPSRGAVDGQLLRVGQSSTLPKLPKRRQTLFSCVASWSDMTTRRNRPAESKPGKRTRIRLRRKPWPSPTRRNNCSGTWGRKNAASSSCGWKANSRGNRGQNRLLAAHRPSVVSEVPLRKTAVFQVLRPVYACWRALCRLPRPSPSGGRQILPGFLAQSARRSRIER